MLTDFGVYREYDRRETEGRKEEIVHIYLFSYDVVRPSLLCLLSFLLRVDSIVSRHPDHERGGAPPRKRLCGAYSFLGSNKSGPRHVYLIEKLRKQGKVCVRPPISSLVSPACWFDRVWASASPMNDKVCQGGYSFMDRSEPFRT